VYKAARCESCTCSQSNHFEPHLPRYLRYHFPLHYFTVVLPICTYSLCLLTFLNLVIVVHIALSTGTIFFLCVFDCIPSLFVYVFIRRTMCMRISMHRVMYHECILAREITIASLSYHFNQSHCAMQCRAHSYNFTEHNM